VHVKWVPIALGALLASLSLAAAWREHGTRLVAYEAEQSATSLAIFSAVQDTLDSRQLLARIAVATFEPRSRMDPDALTQFGPRLAALIPAINSIVWAPRISAAEMTDTLAAIGRTEPVPPAPAALLARSPDDAPRHLVLDIHPRTETNLRSRGLVLSDLALPSAAIAEAIRRRDVQATPPLNLVQLPGVNAFVVYGPVHAPDGELMGVLGFSYRFDQLFGNVAVPERVGIAITDRDAAAFGTVWSARSAESRTVVRRDFAFAGRSYDVAISFADAPDRFATIDAARIAGIGLLGTLIVSFAAWKLARLNRRLVETVAAQRTSQGQLRLLIGELNHRIGNSLTLVLALARQSFKSDRPPIENLRQFEGRIAALARAASISVGNDGGRELGALMKDAGAAFGERFDVSGPEIELGPESAQLLALAIHELATNSLKYGALAQAARTVNVRWTIDRDRFRFQWNEDLETETPLEQPARRGFGSRLLLELLPYQLDGAASRNLSGGRMTFELDVPLESLSA
jgi:two-component sensor histidine kinase/CHASE1-domain containing sensor protein